MVLAVEVHQLALTATEMDMELDVLQELIAMTTMQILILEKQKFVEILLMIIAMDKLMKDALHAQMIVHRQD